MSKNINQVFIANPTTAMQNNDLMYLGRSPYGITDDFAILWSDIILSITLSLQGVFFWQTVTAATESLDNNFGYISNRATIIDYTMPATAAIGNTIKILGLGTGGWRINLNVGQTIHYGDDNVTPTTGTLSSTLRHDCVTLICVVANTDWVVSDSQGNLTAT